ncbi:hypothetical protein BHYA_0041g00110 [Botrytis hyacinthi]|uniref:Uncharacterized protein n=1 Tax=Botrytis hyacinthi TaxID=278943 RepID=A0A4Z1GTL6_9HELO|nr:hypothetical protein BHYA_0041g00110 [Botrytis hyacinthi]
MKLAGFNESSKAPVPFLFGKSMVRSVNETELQTTYKVVRGPVFKSVLQVEGHIIAIISVVTMGILQHGRLGHVLSFGALANF